MARKLRYLPTGSLVEVTTRTLHGRLLLLPSDELREITLGIIGRAQRLYGMTLHAFVFASNHWHGLVTIDDAPQLSAFMAYVNGNLAREVGRLRGWRERVWGRRYQAIVVADEETTQAARLRYLLAHGVKEGLVDAAEEWPGANCVAALIRGDVLEGTWFDRSREYETRRRGIDPGRIFSSRETITLAPIPCWAHLPVAEYQRRTRDLVAEVERRTRLERADSPPLGIDQVLTKHPESSPTEPRRTPAPLIHTASRATRLAFRAAYSLFEHAYRRAARALRDADGRTFAFPPGSFPPRLPYVPLVAGQAIA